MKNNSQPVKKRQYLIDVHKWRSKVALLACTLTYSLSVICIVGSLIYYTNMKWELSDFFRYFTTLSNIITGLASGFIIPFAIMGIRKKRFVFPRWLSMMHYTGTIGTTLTMIFTGIFILPFDPEFAVGGYNKFFHIVCPLAVLVSFMLVESGTLYTVKDSLKCLIPFFLYTIVYFVMVVFIGEENGGWEDLYMLNTFVPGYVSLPLVWILAYIIAFLIRKVFNKIVLYRKNKLMEVWKDDLEPVEIKIEIYGLGRYNGLNGDKTEVWIPYDILEMLSEKYNMDIRALMKTYTKGLIDGIRDN